MFTSVKAFLSDFWKGFEWAICEKLACSLSDEQWKHFIEGVAMKNTVLAMRLDAHRPAGVFPSSVNPFVES